MRGDDGAVDGAEGVAEGVGNMCIVMAAGIKQSVSTSAVASYV